MSRNFKKKKSTSKYRGLKISPLIPIIAIIEVLVLIGVSSYAWYYMSSNKQVNTGIITVDADSGLDIDFKYATKDDYINIWNYLSEDFAFEPVTSLDGRNVFVPTTGTLENTDTTNVVFRDGTVNDINSKYINIDFELTNTTDSTMQVYLNNSSYFRVKNKAGKTDESRALRLAFYPNNGDVGNVTSQLIGGTADYSGKEDSAVDPTKVKTIYFDNTTWNGTSASHTWDKVYAYVFHDESGTDNDYPLTNWPGVEMDRSSGPIYSYAFTDANSEYNKVVFHNGNNSQTSDLTLNNGGRYNKDGYVGEYKAKTVYFVKPVDWVDGEGNAKVFAHAWRTSGSTNYFYTNWDTNGNTGGLDALKYEGSGIYSYTFSSDVSGLLFTNGTWGGTTQTEDITGDNIKDGYVYYISGWGTGKNDGNGNKNVTKTYDTHVYSKLTTKTVYFYNTLGWTTPYTVASMSTLSGHNYVRLPMTYLTGNVYYCNVPEIYSQVYFCDKTNAANRSVTFTYENGKVYRPGEKNASNYYTLTNFQYSDYASSEGYAVISPGVSAGFQRSYTPVVKINDTTGYAEKVIPAFSNSIDNYIYGNSAGPDNTSQTVFEIGPKHILSLSMVVWLEGTDPACSGEAYPGNNIEMRLEFSSKYVDAQGTEHSVNTGDTSTYTYKFYDKTREVWTSDRRDTESGVTVAPVMQLYDNTIGRGYLMSPDSYVTVGGKTKVSCWSVTAPTSVALKGHDIIFRRVNPYDEDEVWNYWHAGPCAGTGAAPITDPEDSTTYPIYTIAQTGTTISFTAFADGSPTKAMLQKNNGSATNANVPDVSCGGLWGNLSVRTLTVVDGLSGHPCHNDSGILTINYSYTYASTGSGNGAGRTATIEYKASDADDIFYYFIMPDIAYTSGADCTFKNYYGFNGSYAINSELNTGLKWRATYKGGTAAGDYFELNRTQSTSSSGDNGTDHHYWGSDILYIETTSNTSDYMYSDYNKGNLMQVHYYVNSTTTSGQDFYSYLYAVDNGTVKGSATTVFVSVVPNSKAYKYYRVETCDSKSTSTKKNRTTKQTITNAADESVSAKIGSTTATASFKRNHLNNKNIIKLDYFQITLYVETNNTSLANTNYDPYIYLWKDGSTTDNNGWPGVKMTWKEDAYGYKRYQYTFDPTHYNRVQLTNNSGSVKTGTLTVNLECNLNVYRTYPNSGFDYQNNASGKSWNNYPNDKTETLVTELYSTNNPHFVVRTTS